MKRHLLTGMVLLGLLVPRLWTQTPVASLQGNVFDAATGSAIPYASIVILGSEPLIGTTSDADGNFMLERVPVGRHVVQASYVGYQSVISSETLVTSAGAPNLDFALTAVSLELEQVTVRPKVEKAQPINGMALVSSRMLSAEEASRYAGGFDDPARLASAFAGVTSGVGHNALAVRGNAPQYLQWRMEGVEIPNPNHFANLAVFGGGGLTALSSHLLDNSDFHSGAFPAEFQNALSAIFDMRMRRGVSSEHRHRVQMGLIGVDLATEGPFTKGGKATYLANYRYSTLGLVEPLLPEDAGGTNYQDLSYKLHFPMGKAGTLSLWGLALRDRSDQQAERDPSQWTYDQHLEEGEAKQYMGATGLTHRLQLSPLTSLHSTLAASISGLDWSAERLTAESVLRPQSDIDAQRSDLTAKITFHAALNKGGLLRMGAKMRRLSYDLNIWEAPAIAQPLDALVVQKGTTILTSAFAQAKIRLGPAWRLVTGISLQHLALSGSSSVEPRFSIQHLRPDGATFGLAYGRHSRMERLPLYFASLPGSSRVINRDLDLTKADHLVLSYDRPIGAVSRLKLEAYYQHLFDVPVIRDSSFSMINQHHDWFFSSPLVNDGKGRNRGVDLTFERFLGRGFYYLTSASLFWSEYLGGDGLWYSSRYDRRFAVNLLGGKEWFVGRAGQNRIGLNLRASLQGGDRYAPVDIEQSRLHQEAIYDERAAFVHQASSPLLFHFTLSYQRNRPHSTHELALKVLNLTGFKEFQGHRFNLMTGAVDEFREALIIPNLSYQIRF